MMFRRKPFQRNLSRWPQAFVMVAAVAMILKTLVLAAPEQVQQQFSIVWRATEIGAHDLWARAFDSAGNFGDSPRVRVNVIADTDAPIAEVTFPFSGSTLSGTINVEGTAADNTGISELYLLVDDVVSGHNTIAPFSFPQDTTPLSDGNHFLYVRAWDPSGNSGDSQRVNFTVANATPTPTPEPTATPTPVPTPTATPTPTPTPVPSPTPTPGSCATRLPNGKCKKGCICR